MVLNGLSNIITIIACTALLEGKSGWGDKKLHQSDLSAFDAEAERLQQRECRELKRDRAESSVEGVEIIE